MSPGPVPKRTDQRRRRNKTDPITKVTSRPTSQPREPDENWHPVAIQTFNSFSESGQSQFYEPSDWAMLHYGCELMSRGLLADRINGQLVTAVLSIFTDLLATEGSRRRARVELEREAPAEPASVALMEKYRSAASQS